MLVVAACGGEAGKLEIRPKPYALAPGKKPVSFRVAEGHQQMALNNVALALESYRNALREDPESIDAFAGIAAAYDRMGRYDLAKRNYEAALAIEPGNTTVLAMLAASLDQQGKSAAAIAVRNEIKQRLAAVDVPAPAPVASPLETSFPVAATQPPAAPPAAPVAVAGAPLPKPDFGSALPSLAASPIAVTLGAIAPAAVDAAFAPDDPEVASVVPLPRPATIAPSAVALAQTAPLASSVTIKLPPPRPVALPEDQMEDAPSAAAVAVSVRLAQAIPPKAIKTSLPTPAAPAPEPPVDRSAATVAAAATAARPSPPLAVATGPGPRLERTTLREVALITSGQPKWASLVVKQDQRSATVRFVSLKEASAKFASVRLLNAARVQGLAARTRLALFDRGWRGMAIGNADATRARSLVLYPAHRRMTALSLARQFGFAAAEKANSKEITVLLGRDAATMVRRSPDG
jgi:hypothetical protein